jgi:hypothetical protein
MAYFHSPTIITNGLVLCLDAANGESFRGEPTTNLTTDTPSMNGWAGGYTLVDTNTKTFLIETRQDNATTTSAWRTFYWSVSAYVGQTITISGDVEFVSESNATFRDITIGQGNTGAFPFHINGSDAADKVVVSTKPINKIRMMWTGVINATGIVGFTQWINNVTANGGNSILRISNVQIEAKPYATPFVNGSRGTTVATGGGFGDLSGNGNNGELVNGPTYNSGNLGSLSFDGVDDYVSIPSFTFTPYCLDFWLYNNNVVPGNDAAIGGPSTYQTLIAYGYPAGVNLGGWTGGATNEALHIWSTTGGNKLTYTQTAVPIGYHNWVFNWNGSNYDIWVDGVKQTVYASTSGHALLQTFTSTIRLANNNSSYYFNGKIYSFKLYTSQLNDSQILQNYNATKGRYGL